MKKYILTIATGLALTAGNAFASEPLLLTETEMDVVSAGFSVVTINQAGFSIGSAATAGTSEVLGISILGFDAAVGAGATAGASAGLGAWGTSNQVIAN